MEIDKQLYKDGLIVVNGYVFYPYEISSYGNTNTKTYAIEPERREDFSIADIDDIPTAEIARLNINFEVMTLKVWRRLKLAFKPNQFNTTYYDWEYDMVVTHKMYFATQDAIDIFENFGTNQEYYITNKKTISIVDTKNDVSKLTVTYNANQGNGSIAGKNVSPSELFTLSDGTGFTRAGYTLLSWNTQPDGSGTEYPLAMNLIISSNLVLYAQWQPTSKRNLSFDYQGAIRQPLDANENNWIISKTVDYNQAVGELPSPTYYLTDSSDENNPKLIKTCSLIGWYNIPYDFRTNGRNHTQWLQEQQQNSMQGVIKKYDSSTIYNVDGNSTIYAHWLPNEATITFVSNGGTEYAPLVSYYGASIDRKIYTPSKEGKVFGGWYLDPQFTTLFTWTMQYKNITVYAKWV